MPRSFYRCLQSEQPAADDFKSYEALGKRPRRDEGPLPHGWDGVSVYDSYRRARRDAKGTNWRIGTYVAEGAHPR